MTPPATIAQSTTPTATPRPRGIHSRAALVVLTAVTLATFWPVVTFRFLLWDDDEVVYANPNFNPPTAEGILYYWKHPAWNLYMPVTMTAWGALAMVSYVPTPDEQGAHVSAALFHACNLVLHLLASGAAFLLLRELFGRPWAACAGALVFAVHPIQVESVAWVGGMNNDLCGLFALLALWQYVLYAKGARHRWLHYAAGAAALLLAMLSKPMAVGVPLMAFVLDLAILRRPIGRAVRDAGIWMLLVVPCLWWTQHIQTGSVAPPTTVWKRPLIAADALLFYLRQVFVPARLGFDYGRSPDWVLAHGRGWISLGVLTNLAIIFFFAARKAPALLAGAGLIAAGLLPVLGLVPFDFQIYSTVADHYAYLAMLGPALAVTWVTAAAPGRIAGVCVGLFIALLAARSFAQTRTWRDNFALFEHGLKVNPNSWAARIDLGAAYLQGRRPAEAVPHFVEAAKLKPKDAQLHRNLGVAYGQLNRMDESVREFREAVLLDPSDDKARRFLRDAVAYRRQLRAASTATSPPTRGPNSSLPPQQ